MKCCSQCNTPLVEGNYYKSASDACKECHKERMADKHAASNENTMYVNGKYISRKHPLFKPGRYKNFSDAAFDGTYKLSSIKEGYVYIITNRAWPDWVKIGMAIDAEDRLNGYQTSSPMRDFVLEHSVYSNDRRASEQEAHTKATKICLDSNAEWFKMTVEQAKHILDNLNEQHNGLPEETSKNTKEDKLQKRSQQEDLWTYAENREAERASRAS